MLRGFLVTRGLGCKGLLVTRGLGRCIRVVIIPPEEPERPRQLRHRGGSGRREDARDPIECFFIQVRLVEVNGIRLAHPIESDVKVDCRRDDNIRVVSTMPKVSRRTRKIVIHARYIRDPDF